MNRSISVFAHFGSLTSGVVGFCRGRKDQNERRDGLISYFALVFGLADITAFGHTAPALIQAAKSATSESLSFPPRGILRPGSVCRIALIRRLLSGSPGTTAIPRCPPLSMSSRLSRRRPPSADSVWQP